MQRTMQNAVGWRALMAGVRLIALFLLTIVGFVAGCGNQKAPVDRTGTNAVAKSFFRDSSWYFGRTVIDVDYEGGQLGTFPGDAALDFQGSDLASMPRIRWVIEENSLFAFRDYELIEGANPGMPEPGSLLGQPIAACEIEKHFDIRRAYTDSTGEELNVIEENDTDRPWYEREYMRVKWGANLLPGYYGQTSDLLAILGAFERQTAELFIQAGSDYEKDSLYAFDFVTQELPAPRAGGRSAHRPDCDLVPIELHRRPYVHDHRRVRPKQLSPCE
jgi:hypothetical protein